MTLSSASVSKLGWISVAEGFDHIGTKPQFVTKQKKCIEKLNQNLKN